MKTQDNNTFNKIAKSFTAFALATIIAIAPAFANGNKGKSTEKISVEDSLMIEELQIAFDLEDEMEQLNTQSNTPQFQVFDSNDKLVFSGSKKEWNNNSNKKLAMLKRKAEFLFDTDGTQVYRIF